MSDKKVVSTNTSVDTKTKTGDKGEKITTITTTTVENYADGSTSTKTQVQTITEQQVSQIRQEENKSQSQSSTEKNSGWKLVMPVIDVKKLTKAKLTTPSSFIDGALKAHNTLRKKHGHPKLELDKDLCKVAQEWANKLAEKGALSHSDTGLGENVFWSSGEVKNGDEAVQLWYDEIHKFDWNNIEFKPGTGHFTQVIWKGSKKLGIAMAKGTTGTFVVANYDPPGNFKGLFPDNVSKPIS